MTGSPSDGNGGRIAARGRAAGLDGTVIRAPWSPIRRFGKKIFLDVVAVGLEQQRGCREADESASFVRLIMPWRFAALGRPLLLPVGSPPLKALFFWRLTWSFSFGHLALLLPQHESGPVKAFRAGLKCSLERWKMLSYFPNENNQQGHRHGSP